MAVAKKRTLPARSSQIITMPMYNKRRKLYSSHIPYDILLDILSRLPVRSLLRFKSVHSSWLSLISSYEFGTAHIRRFSCCRHKFGVIQMENTHTQHPTLLLRIVKQHGDPGFDRVELENPLGYSVNHRTKPIFEVYNSCNGLLLIGVGDKRISNFLLWNPSTRECKNIGRYGSVNLRRYIVGIGYESYSDSYKVVLVFQSIRNKKTSAVYNLKTNCWEKLSSKFPYMMDCVPGAVAALSDDKPYWQVQKLQNNQLDDDESANESVNVIIYFDLEEDKFKELMLPFLAKAGDSVHLSSLRGFLSIGHFDPDEMSEQCIWIRRNDKTWLRWLKSFPIPKYLQPYQYLMPVELMNRGIVMSLDRNAIVYQERTGDCDIVLLSGYGNGSRVAVYAETTVSPHYYYSR